MFAKGTTLKSSWFSQPKFTNNYNNNKNNFISPFSAQKRGVFQIHYPKWSRIGLLPFLSQQSISTHQEYHRRALVKVNVLQEEHSYSKYRNLFDLLDVVSPNTQQVLFTNHIATALNHQFFWEQFERIPQSSLTKPSEDVLSIFNTHFNGIDKFQTMFEEYALAHQGNGWTWLAVREGQYEIINTKGETSLWSVGGEVTPVLALDMAEHAYFPDYQHDVERYVKNFWKVLNWDVINRRLGGQKKRYADN